MDVMCGNLVAQQAAGGAVVSLRDRKAARKRAHAINEDERDLLSLPLTPRQATNPRIGNEARVGPDAVLVESPADPQAERDGVSVIDEHHRFAEHLSGM